MIKGSGEGSESAQSSEEIEQKMTKGTKVEAAKVAKVPKRSITKPPKKVIEEENMDEGELVFVMPGDIIGTTEEFIPGIGTFLNVADIHAASTGIVKIDRKARMISVVPSTKYPPSVNVGDIVVGSITSLRESVVLVEIAAIKDEGEREFQKVGIAAIHVSNVKDSYCKRLDEEFSVGDIIKAKVLNTENMRLSTAEQELGVMKAQCFNCRTVMVKDNNKLLCPECGRTEKRKLSQDYGTGIV
ncbi:putative RNA-binding protein (consists of S1 domain and a Zn-ribbon domain) [Methanomethylovorans hollandica DSM 15978]|jgi:exosome complex component CSL4|uniref:Exosome complex component Csl4 n=1 Tax=Methanomethylovorans hollandica (strain DSM 15978 / NBRC 107637 / DMS1) TaxID=867904 RepID=L0L295_METHD|nr:exosome complex RNA-binding protein Csl4 [Methanomethylovorans hollandica]AGB50399.1 putative RNA-binding protein (consists of S1 domain and a Zn-ribbon domain) [Methanomethylovorans hollandica DSM 15978]